MRRRGLRFIDKEMKSKEQNLVTTHDKWLWINLSRVVLRLPFRCVPQATVLLGFKIFSPMLQVEGIFLFLQYLQQDWLMPKIQLGSSSAALVS